MWFKQVGMEYGKFITGVKSKKYRYFILYYFQSNIPTRLDVKESYLRKNVTVMYRIYTCFVHQSYVWHVQNQSWKGGVGHYEALFRL